MSVFKSENEIDMVESVSLSMTVSFDHPVKVWVLQMGGWLPLPFCSAQILLIDRNVISVIADLKINPDRPDMVVQRWWLSHLSSGSCLINPLLCAIEGATKSTPTYQDFRYAFDAAIDVLASGLPNANLVNYQDIQYQAAYCLVEQSSCRYHKEAQFLIQIAPLIATRSSMSKAKFVESEIIDAARSINLSLQSIIVMCAMSCLYEPQDGAEPMIGRNVIKPTPKYSANDAHNAISDIRALEILALSSGLGLGTHGYCTRDKYLAAFWCALGLLPENKTSVRAEPYMQLFPRLSRDEIVQLLLRLGGTKQ